MAKVAISQPTYLPWLGYFEQISRADYFVFLDCVQFDRRSWQSRNRLKNANNSPFWLTVPVQKHTQTTRLDQIKIAYDHQDWQAKHLKSIKLNLAQTPCLDQVITLLEPIYQKKIEYLVDLNIEIIQTLSRKLRFHTEFIRASELNLDGKKADLLLNIATHLGADCYLSNSGSRVYLEDYSAQFQQKGIDIHYQAWSPPIYKQKFGEFVPHLAWVDPVSYLGLDKENLFFNAKTQGG